MSKRRLQTEKQRRAYKTRWQRKQRADRKRAGVCYSCGRRRPRPGTESCRICLAAQARYKYGSRLARMWRAFARIMLSP